MRLVVDGGEISESVPGAVDRGWGLRTGEFFWQDGGVTRAVKNIGTTPVNIVEFELKLYCRPLLSLAPSPGGAGP